MMWRHLAVLAMFATPGTAGSAMATAAPISDIPWLSESVTVAPAGPPARPPSVVPPQIRGTEEITVRPLDAISKEAAGLLSPEVTGFAPDLWGTSDVATLRSLIGDLGYSGVPAAQALLRRILIAEAEPPRPGTGGESLLMTRIDRLLAMGALSEAAALVEVAGADTPELFLRWFDIGLLTDDSNAQCEALRLTPTLSPTLPARVFCLARNGDWNAAEITLMLGSEVGEISEDRHALLARFLDPELFEGEPEPPIPDPLTPIDFLMREATGLPRPSLTLPLAFLHHDLTDHAPMRMRVDAAERLVLAGSAGPDALRAAYLAGEPAASGGIWSRAEAVQDLEAALETGEPAEIGMALQRADDALSARGLRVAFARFEAEGLASIDAARLDAGARTRLFELQLLAEELKAAGAAAPENDPLAALALALARNDAALPPAPADDPLAAAIRTGLLDRAASDIAERGITDALARGDQAEVMLRALDLLDTGADIDPASLQSALRALALSGQESTARRIAIETLFARPDRLSG